MLTPLLVSGRVSNLAGKPTLASIELTWSPPEEPNGELLSYEVTYRVHGSLITTNTTHLNTSFVIHSLTPGIQVSDISVTVYNSQGRGEPEELADLHTLNTIRKPLAASSKS